MLTLVYRLLTFVFDYLACFVYTLLSFESALFNCLQNGFSLLDSIFKFVDRGDLCDIELPWIWVGGMCFQVFVNVCGHIIDHEWNLLIELLVL